MAMAREGREENGKRCCAKCFSEELGKRLALHPVGKDVLPGLMKEVVPVVQAIRETGFFAREHRDLLVNLMDDYGLCASCAHPMIDAALKAGNSCSGLQECWWCVNAVAEHPACNLIRGEIQANLELAIQEAEEEKMNDLERREMLISMVKEMVGCRTCAEHIVDKK